MYRSSHNPIDYRQPPSSSVDNHRKLNELATKPPSSRITRQSPSSHFDHDETVNESTMRPTSGRISRQSPSSHFDHDETVNESTMRPKSGRISRQSPSSHFDHDETVNESTMRPTSGRTSRQSTSSNFDNHRALDELVMKPPGGRISRQSPSSHFDHDETVNESTMRPKSGRISRQSPSSHFDHDETVNESTMRPTSGRTSRQSTSSNFDNHRALDELVMKPPGGRISRQSPSSHFDHDETVNESTMRPTSGRISRQSPRTHNDEWDDNKNQTLRKLVANQPLNPSRSRSSSPGHVSLTSMVIEGKWKYRGHDDEHLRLKINGIENLVNICHDIMSKTYESINRKHEKRRKYPLTSQPWPIVKVDEYKKLTNTERTGLNRAKLLNLMTIVYEAASTSASISQLVRIWREASEHNLHPRRSKSSQSRPTISYKDAFQHLIRTPDNQLLQIAVHASLISTQKQSKLQKIGDELGIRRNQFDMNSIRDSTEAFQYLIKLLRKQKLKQKQDEKYIDTKRLPYEREKKRGLSANVSGTKFRLICQAVDASGFDISPDPDFTCNLLWNDTLISMDIVSALKPYQRVNHFPTMNEISRKDLLAKNYDRLSNLMPKEYNFAPKTWILPNDYNLWYSYASNKPKKDPSAYIAKPTHAAMSQGIAIHCDYKQLQPMNNYIIQEYIREPYLMDGFKFDLRIYALITSCDPLRVFIFNNGLVRISSKKYEIPNPKNALDLSMHLTNYEIADDLDMDNAKKRSLKSLFDDLKKQNCDVDKLWKEIQNIVLKTIFLAEPHLLTAYRTCRQGTLPTSESVCFELLGFDILIDKKLKPWIIEVNRCPSFDTNEQLEFDIKIKLLLDTFNLLHFQVSDRKKSSVIEKTEAQRRLYLTLGKRLNELDELKENLFLLRQEQARENYEHHHSNGFIRLFPIENENRMNELMNILTKCFQILYKNKNDSSWNIRYYHRFNEEELLEKINRLENKKTSSLTLKSSDEENESPDPFMKRKSTQTPSDILRSTSLNTPKQQSNSLATTGHVTRPQDESEKAPPGVSAIRIKEIKSYDTIPHSENPDRQRSPSAKSKRSNDKSQMVNYSSIIRATRKQQSIDQPTTIDIIKELQLTPIDLNRLHQLTFDQMDKLCIHYPNKSDKETYKIYDKINDNWNRYKSDVGRFWLAELDTDKRESVIEIAWNSVQQIIRKICVVDELIQQLPLNRHLLKLKRRLLSNHGQCFWDACQDRHNSWESLFVKSTNSLSTIELDCCYCFVGLCKQALFIVYQYSIDEKFFKQKQIDQGLTLMIES